MVGFLWLLWGTLWDIQLSPPVWDVSSVPIMLTWHLSQKPESITAHSLLTLFNNYLENRLRLSDILEITWLRDSGVNKGIGSRWCHPLVTSKTLEMRHRSIESYSENHLNGEIHMLVMFLLLLMNEYVLIISCKQEKVVAWKTDCGVENMLAWPA